MPARPLRRALALTLLLLAVAPAAAPAAGQTISFDCASVTEISTSECEALVALYEATDGPNWTDTTGWTGGTAPCAALGVTCEDGAVTHLELRENGLAGPLPPELGDLAGLRIFRLSLDPITGTIPPELGDLTALTDLRLELTDLTGPIPPELGRLTALTFLGLGQNDLTGPIPPELANLTRLTSLSLRSNDLTGPIPPGLGSLVALEWLFLSENDLTGTIPPELGALTALTRLGLNTNRLTGAVPAELANLTRLTWFWLFRNDLAGPLPVGLTALAAMEDFRFHDTGLCEPDDPAFAAWLGSIQTVNRTGVACDSTPTATEDDPVPHALTLGANHPNPFNPSTRIRFTVAAAGRAELVIIDLLGREVARPFDAVAVPGRTYEVTFEAGGLPSGVYLYRLREGGRARTGTMTLVQ